jgi:hypothetical protein
MNICREVKAPPQEQAPEPIDDEVLLLEIHSPLKESNSLRESVNYRKQDHNMTTTQREISHAIMWTRKSTILNFEPFSMQTSIALYTRVKKKHVINM